MIPELKPEHGKCFHKSSNRISKRVRLYICFYVVLALVDTNPEDRIAGTLDTNQRTLGVIRCQVAITSDVSDSSYGCDALGYSIDSSERTVDV